MPKENKKIEKKIPDEFNDLRKKLKEIRSITDDMVNAAERALKLLKE